MEIVTRCARTSVSNRRYNADTARELISRLAPDWVGYEGTLDVTIRATSTTVQRVTLVYNSSVWYPEWAGTGLTRANLRAFDDMIARLQQFVARMNGVGKTYLTNLAKDLNSGNPPHPRVMRGNVRVYQRQLQINLNNNRSRLLRARDLDRILRASDAG